MARTKIVPYPIFRSIAIHKKYDHEMVMEVLDAANKNHEAALQFESQFLLADFNIKRLQAENEFLIRWINSRIQDKFNED